MQQSIQPKLSRRRCASVCVCGKSVLADCCWHVASRCTNASDSWYVCNRVTVSHQRPVTGQSQ